MERTAQNWITFPDWELYDNNPLGNPKLRHEGTNGPGGMDWNEWDNLLLLADEGANDLHGRPAVDVVDRAREHWLAFTRDLRGQLTDHGA